MEFANDMRNLRHGIDQMRAARGEMIEHLRAFAGALSDNVARQMSEMQSRFARESARARIARAEFAAHNRRMVGEMMAMFGGERIAARRNFFGKGA